MIEVIEGKGVGAGKSYFVIERLMAHWVSGGTAYASESFCVLWDACKEYAWKRHGVRLVDDQYHAVPGHAISTLHNHTPPGTDDCPVLLVIDEAQDQLNARDWSDKSKRELFQWCCQSRHDNNDLLFVSQSAANIDKQIRRLATFNWSVRNMDNFPIAGFGKVGPLLRAVSLGMCRGKVFCRTLLDYDGRTPLERKWLLADWGLFQCYRSKSMAMQRKRLGAAIGRRQLEKRKGSTMIKYVVILALAAIVVFGVKVYRHGIIDASGGDSIKSVGGKGQARPAAPAPAAKVTVPAYDVIQEPWLYREGERLYKLPSGYYKPQRMSVRGFVESIQDGVIRIRQPDGRLLYITTDDTPRPISQSSGSAAVQTSATPARSIVVAPYSSPERIK